MTFPDARDGRPALRHYLLLYAVVAVWVDFGHVHQRHSADTLLFTLASQYALTPFFWEQDRIGLLVPALTTWCPDPLVALLIQTALTVFLGLAAPLLLAEVVCPRPVGRVAATLANAMMLAFSPGRIGDNLLYECCYPQAITLGCAGILVLAAGGDRPRVWRYPVAAGLLVLAHWVYAGVSAWLMPLALWVAVIRPGVPLVGFRDAVTRLIRYFPGWVSLLLLGGTFWLGMRFMKMAQDADPEIIRPTPQKSLPRGEWATSWWGYIESLDRLPEMRTWATVAAVLAAGGLVAGVGVAVVRRKWPPYPLAAAVVVAGLAGMTELLFMGTRDWPAQNGRNVRYIIGFLESAQVILGLAAVIPFAGWAAGRGRWVVFGAAAGVLLVGATVRYGFPAPGRPRADLDMTIGALTPDVLTADVDAIGGDYWTVWPAVFHANMAGPERARPFAGVTLRSSVFRAQWERDFPGGMRVGVRDTEQERNNFFYAVHLYKLTPPVRIGTHGKLAIYTTGPAPRPAGAGH